MFEEEENVELSHGGVLEDPTLVCSGDRLPLIVFAEVCAEEWKRNG